MLGAALLLCALGVAQALQGHPGLGFSQQNFAAYTPSSQASSSLAHYKVTCEKIAQSISSASQVFYPGELRVVGL